MDDRTELTEAEMWGMATSDPRLRYPTKGAVQEALKLALVRNDALSRDLAAQNTRIAGLEALADHLDGYNPGHGDYATAARMIRAAVSAPGEDKEPPLCEACGEKPAGAEAAFYDLCPECLEAFKTCQGVRRG